jgi:hypothetical protein
MVVLIHDDSAEVVWQAAASLYTLGACLREGEEPFGVMADASRALHGPFESLRTRVDCNNAGAALHRERGLGHSRIPAERGIVGCGDPDVVSG